MTKAVFITVAWLIGKECPCSVRSVNILVLISEKTDKLIVTLIIVQ